MNGDALGVVGHVAGGARAEQPLVGRPPEVVEAAEVADVGRAASGVGAVPAHGGGGMQVVLRVAADVYQSPARIEVISK